MIQLLERETGTLTILVTVNAFGSRQRRGEGPGRQKGGFREFKPRPMEERIHSSDVPGREEARRGDE